MLLFFAVTAAAVFMEAVTGLRFSRCYLNPNSFFVLTWIGEAIDYELRLVAIYSHKREVLHQVDVPDFDVFCSSYIVDSANQ